MSKPTTEAVCKRCAGTKKYLTLVDCPDHEEPEADWMEREFVDAREQQAELPAWLRGEPSVEADESKEADGRLK